MQLYTKFYLAHFQALFNGSAARPVKVKEAFCIITNQLTLLQADYRIYHTKQITICMN